MEANQLLENLTKARKRLVDACAKAESGSTHILVPAASVSLALDIMTAATLELQQHRATAATPAAAEAGGVGVDAIQELCERAHWHGWFCRERLDGPDAGPVVYPAGLDYEQKQDYAFSSFWQGSRVPATPICPNACRTCRSGAGEVPEAGEEVRRG